jgi:hypothetical protein
MARLAVVMVLFLIDAQGKVSTADASGVDAGVAGYIADVIHTVPFPASKDGPTQVSYPFSMSN